MNATEVSAQIQGVTGSRQARCSAVVGLQWGDEGKGKVVDLLAGDHDAIVRYNGGANAGHSVVVGGQRYALHLVPSGILYPQKLAVIANGVVVDPEQLVRELDALGEKGVDTSGIVVSSRAHVVMQYHKDEDARREDLLKACGQQPGEPESDGDSDGGGWALGTTRRGIGPCYAEKVQRAGAVRVADLLRPDVLRTRIEAAARLRGGELDVDEVVSRAGAAGRRLEGSIRDTTYLLHDLLADGKRLLFEGANATLLDIDHGTFPYVTSSNSCALGIASGSGVPASRLGRVTGVLKAYATRVGMGPMPTELLNATGDRIRERGREYGTTTGRPRRTGWLDLVAARYAAMLNGATELSIMLLDVLAGFDELEVCTAYEIDGHRTDRFSPDSVDLERAKPVYETFPGFANEITDATTLTDIPSEARRYLDRIEEFVGVPVGIVSVGPGREQTIVV